MSVLTLWISPHDTFKTVDDVVNEAAQVHLPGLTTRVLLPTAYGQYLQGTPGINRSIGDSLAPSTLDGIQALRQEIESHGVSCGGWSVPRGTGDPATEGYLHGQIAALFDDFVLNFEQWTSVENDPREQFWTHPQNADAVNAYIGGFWKALTDAGRSDALSGHVGLTWVTNSMLTNASDPVKKAFIEGTNYDCLEAYIPGDPNLDPGAAMSIWASTLQRLGDYSARPVVTILEQGDLPSLARLHSTDVGVQVWTLATAAGQAWPVGDQPAPEGDLQQQINDLEQQLQAVTADRDNLQGVNKDLGTQLAYVQQLKTQMEDSLTKQIADLNARISDIQTQDRANTTALQNRINELTAQVSDLQGHLSQALTADNILREYTTALTKVQNY